MPQEETNAFTLEISEERLKLLSTEEENIRNLGPSITQKALDEFKQKADEFYKVNTSEIHAVLMVKFLQ